MGRLRTIYQSRVKNMGRKDYVGRSMKDVKEISFRIIMKDLDKVNADIEKCEGCFWRNMGAPCLTLNEKLLRKEHYEKELKKLGF